MGKVCQIAGMNQFLLNLALAVLLTVLGGKFLLQRAQQSQVANAAVPNPTLTPGATRPVVLSDVCSMAHEEVVREVPAALRQRVFSEYRIANPRVSEYEIDFLIAPGLGGTDDVHNLWPEPEQAPLWNARVKDELEEQLHEMVCDGQLDLSTAQSDIAKDWVGAYKKYFHTDKPLPAAALTRVQVRTDDNT